METEKHFALPTKESYTMSSSIKVAQIIQSQKPREIAICLAFLRISRICYFQIYPVTFQEFGLDAWLQLSLVEKWYFVAHTKKNCKWGVTDGDFTSKQVDLTKHAQLLLSRHSWLDVSLYYRCMGMLGVTWGQGFCPLNLCYSYLF